MTIYDRSVRERACGLFDRGFGYGFVAKRLEIPPEAVRKWQRTYRAVGRGGLLDMSTHRRYDYEAKVAAASAVVDGGMAKPEAMERFGIASLSPLKQWCRLYREGRRRGAQARAEGQAEGIGRRGRARHARGGA